MAIIESTTSVVASLEGLGVNVPQGAGINVVQNIPGQMNIVFPMSTPLVVAPSVSASQALPDSALSSISGGGTVEITVSESAVNGIFDALHAFTHAQIDLYNNLLDSLHDVMPGVHAAEGHEE